MSIKVAMRYGADNNSPSAVMGGGGSGSTNITNVSATATGLIEGSHPTVSAILSETDLSFAFGIPRGATGPTGPVGNGIVSIEKTSTSGRVDTYTITFTDGSTTTFQITNGEAAEIPVGDYESIYTGLSKTATVTLDISSYAKFLIVWHCHYTSSTSYFDIFEEVTSAALKEQVVGRNLAVKTILGGDTASNYLTGRFKVNSVSANNCSITFNSTQANYNVINIDIYGCQYVENSMEPMASINGVDIKGALTFEELGEETITNIELKNIIDAQFAAIFGGN